MKYTLYTIENHVAVISINRPDVLNAVNADVVGELVIQFKKAIADPDIGVIILTGVGEKAFIAGADIKAMQKMVSADESIKFGREGQALTLLIEESPKPVIAAVNGFALGGGCEISLACHIRIASENAMFGQPEVKLGIIPGWGGTQRLPEIVGRGIATELIVTGAVISAQEAYRIGLVNKVIPLIELMPEVQKMASKIIQNGPNAIQKSLECINIGMSLEIREGLEVEVKAFSELFGTEESKIGLTAFVEKKRADFRS